MYSETGMNEGGFLKPNINTLVINAYGDQVKWITNSTGFRNTKEFTYKKPKNTFRILSLGDSFTAGYRVGQHQTFSYLLEKQLNESQDSIHYEVIIACIEDPVNGLKFLHEYGLKYEPDLVLLGITLGNDLTQTFINLHKFGRNKLVGNNIVENENFNEKKLYEALQERFPEGSCDYSFEINDYIEKLVSFRLLRNLYETEYSGESIFASRGKANPYLHDLSHGLGLFLKEPPQSINETYIQFGRVLSAYKRLSNKNSFKLVTCSFPQRYQGNWLDYKATLTDYGLKENAFSPSPSISFSCTLDFSESPLCVSEVNGKYSPFTKENYYLPMGDMHWNSKGHLVVSEYLFENLEHE